MKTGFVQFAPAIGEVRQTITKLDHLTRHAPPVDLLVLPELCNSGYNFASSQQARESSETVTDSVFLRYIMQFCIERNCHVVTGFNERDGDTLYNSAALVGPPGVKGIYRKLHLFYNEKEYFAPGDRGLPVFDIGVAQIGMLICFDWIFPEVWRILALKGADIICHPSNLVLPDLAQRGVPAHALMNRVFTLTANRTGTEREMMFTGRSMICNTLGEVVATASTEDECVRVVEIDVNAARNKEITSKNNIFADRRPEEYQSLTDSPTARR